MNRLLTSILLFLFPCLVLADNTLTFAPPSSDVSVVFLGNLFGVVDGVLHGTGSQIMGSMFGVFNAAVLALGGIIIMYTLLVSTMNTAHEGQMLGQKWSSIWIPVRSTLGLALLIPKASGYCLMQIFVMWVIVQGVGAADKIWDAALSYLNRGGVIIQAQINPGTALLNSGGNGVSIGALNILAGQVCMLGLQNQLQSLRQSYIDQKNDKIGPCYNDPQPPMKTICDTAIPDFIGTVNAVVAQNDNKDAGTFTLKMPNFDQGSPFNFLNGICGSIAWNRISDLDVPTSASSSGNNNVSVGYIHGITTNELSTAQMSRAIAIQQMYLDLSSVAQIMVNNDPALSSNGGTTNSSAFSLVANQQFGVPYTKNSNVCSGSGDQCVIWGFASGTSSGVLFNGTEFIGAINDYNGIMMPTLNLINQSKSTQVLNNARAFINDASTQGWMMAGSYFFDLVKIQGSATANQNTTDSNTGLNSSTFDTTTMLSPFGDSGCTGIFADLCTWFNKDKSKINQIQSLINGYQLTLSKGKPVTNDKIVQKPDLTQSIQNLVDGLDSSTVYGFITNSVKMQGAQQPGLNPLTFANMIHFNVDSTMYYLQEQEFPCGPVKIIFFSFCFGKMMGNLFYNLIFRFIYNIFLTIFQQIINQVIMAFLMIPLTGMAQIFKQGVATISEPGVNPIIALANMGTQYINFAGNLWIMLLTMAVTSALIPVFGLFIFALIALAMPLLLAWVGIMVSVGFTTAYYIPILPYMIFTFGTLGWLISVIEAMVAAPIVALGVTHPEGHEAFGKGEPAIMILINVFLRPSMMIIGYIAAIALSYVGVWVLNAGFDHAIGYIQQGGSAVSNSGCEYNAWSNCSSKEIGSQLEEANWQNSLTSTTGSGTGGYSDWAGIYAFFFSILIYTTMYLIMIQKAFTLITYLPDKVLRWIGGAPETMGETTAQWGEEVKSAGKEAGGKTQDAQGQMDKTLGGYGQKAVGSAKEGLGQAGGSGGTTGRGGNTGTGPSSTPSKPDGGDGGKGLAQNIAKGGK